VKRESRLSVCELRGNAKLLRERKFCLKKKRGVQNPEPVHTPPPTSLKETDLKMGSAY